MQERTLWIGRTAARLLMSAEGGVADVCHVAAATVPKLALAEQAMLWIVQPETSEAPLRSARTHALVTTQCNVAQRCTETLAKHRSSAARGRCLRAGGPMAHKRRSCVLQRAAACGMRCGLQRQADVLEHCCSTLP